MNITHLLIRQARQRPDGAALIEGGGFRSARRITFAELEMLSAKAAGLLSRDGVVAGDRVLIFLPMSVDLYLALIAVFRIGAVATFLDPSAALDHMTRACEMASPAALIGTGKAHLLRLVSPALRKIPRPYVAGWPFPGASRWRKEYSRLEAADIVERADDDPALLTFTSGSTGLPKGAIRTHGFLAAQHRVLEETIELRPGEVDLATLPIFALANLASGVTTVIPAADLRRPGLVRPLPILRQAMAERVTRSTASPAFFDRLLGCAAAGNALSGVKRVYTGGAPVFPGLLERLQKVMPQARIIALYGSTEAEPIAHIAWDDMSGEDIAAMFGGAGLLAGPPVPQIQLRVLPNRWGTPIEPMSERSFAEMALAPMAAGEIVVQGAHVLGGYLNGHGDEQTKFGVGGAVWHRTGDAGYLDQSGRLWLLGRAEARITDERGTIHPFAVECAATRLPGVRRSALVGQDGRRVLVVESINATPPETDQIKSALSWALLDDVLAVRSIPVDKRHNAKIDYPALRNLLARRLSKTSG